MKKKDNNNINRLLEYVLKEDNPPPPPQNMADFAPVETPKDASLDQVVDRYIIRYERESIPTAESYEEQLYGEAVEEGVPHFSKVVSEALLEQPEEEEEEEELEEEPEEEPAGLDLGDEGGEAPPPGEEEGEEAAEAPGAPAVVATPQINLNDFARSIARMVNNYEALLNPKNIIINRVEEYIKSNYDERTAQELMEILDTNYSLRTDEAEAEKEEEPSYAEPYMVGALGSE